METLFIQTKKELKHFILNTQIPSQTTDKFVNDLLNTHPDCDWWIQDGWKL